MKTELSNGVDSSESKTAILEQLRTIPGVGPSIANDLWQLGIHSVDDLKNRDPELLYHTLCEIRQQPLDRCLLYVFRCAVYFASNEAHDPELLKWWNWKETD